MSVNKYKPHLYILPEDDANRQIATGFQRESAKCLAICQVLPIAKGWKKVVELFEEQHVPEMANNTFRNIVLLVDFDSDFENRISSINARIPDRLKSRVFVLGVYSEPEKLKANLGSPSFEKIGSTLAVECETKQHNWWKNALLVHNVPELVRIRDFLARVDN